MKPKKEQTKPTVVKGFAKLYWIVEAVVRKQSRLPSRPSEPNADGQDEDSEDDDKQFEMTEEKFNELMDAAEGHGNNLLKYMKTEFAEPLGLQSTINTFKKTAYYAMEKQNKFKFKSSWDALSMLAQGIAQAIEEKWPSDAMLKVINVLKLIDGSFDPSATFKQLVALKWMATWLPSLSRGSSSSSLASWGCRAFGCATSRATRSW